MNTIIYLGPLCSLLILVTVDSNRLDYYRTVSLIIKIVGVALLAVSVFYTGRIISVAISSLVMVLLLRKNNESINKTCNNVLYKKNTYEIISDLSEVLLSGTLTIRHNETEINLEGLILTNESDIIADKETNKVVKAYCNFNISVIAEILMLNGGILYFMTGESLFIIQGALLIMLSVMSVLSRNKKIRSNSKLLFYVNLTFGITMILLFFIFILYLSKERNDLWNLLNIKI